MTSLRVVKVSVAEKKYNPDQPRVPAGDPRGGQWAPKDGVGSGVSQDGVDKPPVGEDGWRLLNGGTFSQRELDLAPRKTLSNEERAQLKYAGMDALMKDARIDRDTADEVQRAWARTAHDHGGLQDYMHAEAYDRAENISDLQRPYTLDAYTLDQQLTKKERYAVFDSIYRRTQQFFADKGLKPDDTIVVYRGMRLANERNIDGAEGDVVDFRSYPLASWSLDYDTASTFSSPHASRPNGIIIGVRVPVKGVFSHFSTGYGSAGEQEVVLLGAYTPKVKILERRGLE